MGKEIQKNYIKQAKGFDTCIADIPIPKNAVYGHRNGTYFYVHNFQQFKLSKQRYEIYLMKKSEKKFRRVYMIPTNPLMQIVLSYVADNNLYDVRTVKKGTPELGKDLNVKVIRTRNDYVKIVLRRSGLNRDNIQYSENDKCYYLSGRYTIRKLNVQYSISFYYDKPERLFELKTLRNPKSNFYISGDINNFSVIITSDNVFTRLVKGEPNKMVNATIKKRVGNTFMINDFYGSIGGFKIKYKPEQNDEYDGYDEYDENHGPGLQSDFYGLRYTYRGLYK